MIQMKIIAVIILAVILAAAGTWYWQKKTPAPREESGGLGARIFDTAQNPLKERVPDTNPFSADTNPFDARINPFKSEYKNPFQ